ncbi:MAG TPA: hypothetical protein VM452_16540, partial [Caulifigura sp.]|nr:hypothetical protein [Caulifigura sp.]
MLARGLSSRCVWPVLSLVVAGVMAGGIAARDAIGQDRGGFGFAGGTVFTTSRPPSVTTIVMSESARQEVGINPEQQAQIEKLNDERRRSLSGVDVRSMSDEERLRFFEKQQADAEAKLKSILTPDQYTRLQQLAWHRSGPLALRTEPLATEFHLTEEQKNQFDTIRDAQRQSARDMIRLSPE